MFLSLDLQSGLEFLAMADKSIELGEHYINENVKAIVETYKTKVRPQNEMDIFFEAHKNVIDIQYPIIGSEQIQWSPIQYMVQAKEYDEKNDRTYYKLSSSISNHVNIGGGIFGVMFPSDGHAPQFAVGHAEIIKKITIKVRIN